MRPWFSMERDPEIDEINKALKEPKKMEQACQKKSSKEVKKEIQFRRAGDVTAAGQCLGMKSEYEGEIKWCGNYRYRIKKLRTKLGGVKAIALYVGALKAVGASLERRLKGIDFDDALQTIKEIDGHLAWVSQFQDSLQTTPVAGSGSNEEEFGAELEEMGKILLPATTAPAAPVHVSAGLVRPVPEKTALAA